MKYEVRYSLEGKEHIFVCEDQEEANDFVAEMEYFYEDDFVHIDTSYSGVDCA